MKSIDERIKQHEERYEIARQKNLKYVTFAAKQERLMRYHGSAIANLKAKKHDDKIGDAPVSSGAITPEQKAKVEAI